MLKRIPLLSAILELLKSLESGLLVIRKSVFFRQIFLHVATYLEFLLQSNSSYSALEAAVYGIRWAHDFFGLSNPCDSNLVKGILESAKRSLSRPIVKKEPVTPDMVFSTCQKLASANANLSDLRTAAICVTAFAGFLRFNELANLRCCDVKFC